MKTFSIMFTATAALLAFTIMNMNIVSCEGKVTKVTLEEALAATVNMQLPDGITLTGSVEPVEEPKEM